MKRAVQFCLTAVAAAAVVACGDGSGTAAGPTSLSGQVVKGPVNGATVCVYALSGGVRAATPVVPCATTDASGNYTFANLASYSGDVVVEASGGSFKDEATGTTQSLSSPMSTVVSASGGSLTAVVTPLTTIAVSQSASSLSASAVSAAAATIAAQAGLGSTNILATLPTYAANGTTATNTYAAALGGISQYILSNGKTLQQAIAGWTAANQAAYQSALSTYVAAGGVSAGAVPASMNFSVSVSSSGSGAASSTGVPSTVSGSGGAVSSSSLSVSGGSAAFAPLSGVGLVAGDVQTITFNGISGTGTQSLMVVKDSKGIEVVYHEGSLTNPLAAGSQWRYTCAGAACTGKVTVDSAGKTLTISSIALNPDGKDAGAATGSVTVAGSGTYQ